MVRGFWWAFAILLQLEHNDDELDSFRKLARSCVVDFTHFVDDAARTQAAFQLLLTVEHKRDTGGFTGHRRAKFGRSTMWDEYTKLVVLFKCWLDCCAAQAEQQPIPCPTKVDLLGKSGYLTTLQKTRAIIDGDKCECILKLASPLQGDLQVRVSADCIILWWALMALATSFVLSPHMSTPFFFSLCRRVSFSL